MRIVRIVRIMSNTAPSCRSSALVNLTGMISLIGSSRAQSAQWVREILSDESANGAMTAPSKRKAREESAMKDERAKKVLRISAGMGLALPTSQAK